MKINYGHFFEINMQVSDIKTQQSADDFIPAHRNWLLSPRLPATTFFEMMENWEGWPFKKQHSFHNHGSCKTYFAALQFSIYVAKAVCAVGSFEEEEAARKWQNNGSWQSLFYAGGYQNKCDVRTPKESDQEGSFLSFLTFGSNWTKKPLDLLEKIQLIPLK